MERQQLSRSVVPIGVGVLGEKIFWRSFFYKNMVLIIIFII